MSGKTSPWRSAAAPIDNWAAEREKGNAPHMLHGWEKLTADERRVILDGIRDNTVYSGPYHVDFSPTDACNYTCFFCNSAWVDRSKRLPWDRMQGLMEELAAGGLKSARLSGGGEPLIYPQIDQFLDFCLERKIDITNVTTNAFKLNDRIGPRLLDLNASEIIVSFNDIDPARYAATNGTTERSFHVVKDNIKNFIVERNRRGLKNPGVVLQFFCWKGNCDQIERAYDLGLELGVDVFYFRDMWGVGPEKRMNPRELATARAGMQRILERDREMKRVQVSFGNEKILEEQKTYAEQGKERGPDPDRREFCYIGWYSTVIWGNGAVYPCCNLAVTENYPPLGNVLEAASFDEIWRGANYAKLRDELREIALREGEYPKGNQCFTRHWCAMRHACQFVSGLADAEFYDDALSEVKKLRRRPGFRVKKAARVLSRYRFSM